MVGGLYRVVKGGRVVRENRIGKWHEMYRGKVNGNGRRERSKSLRNDRKNR